MKSPICYFLFFVFLSPMGFSQEKAKDATLTSKQQAQIGEAKKIILILSDLYGRGRYAEATPLAIEALKINREVLGDKHPDTAKSINDLALNYLKQGQYPKAEPLFVEALTIRREVLGNKHPDTAKSINDLALLYSGIAQYGKAEPLYLEALKINRELFGEKHPSTANSIGNLAQFYSESAQKAKAEPLFVEALKIKREILDKKHPDTVTGALNLANLYSDIAEYGKAETLYLEALKINREILGDKHPVTVTILNNLGLLYSRKGQYTKSESLYLEALKIRREVSGDKHPDTAISALNLASHYSDIAQYGKAEPLYLEALKINRELFGEKHPNTASSLNNLALSYSKQTKYAKAEPLYLEALTIRREVLGNKHSDTAISALNLASHYSDIAEYGKAEPLYLEALKINRELFGEKHPNTASSLNNLALSYDKKAQYAKAEPLYLEALKIKREILGNKHPDTAATIGNLAGFYREQGQYAKAEPLFLEGLKIYRETFGDKNIDTAISLNNLGLFYSVQNQYEKAEPLYLESLKIRKEVLGTNNSSYAISLNNLGMLYQDQTQYSKAEPLLVEALKIHRAVLGNKHPNTANSINNLAGLFLVQGQVAKAEPLCFEGLKIRKEVLGNMHPNTASSLNNLAGVYNRKGQYDQAGSIYLEALKSITDYLFVISAIQSEYAQIMTAEKNKKILDSFLSNVLIHASPGGGYDQVLSWKGMIYRRQNLLRALQGNDPLKKELRDAIRQLANLLKSTPKPSEVDQYDPKVKALSEKKEKLEKELAKQIPKLNLAKVTPAELQNMLALDAALVDIFQYNHSSPSIDNQGKLVFEYRYAAWVIRKDKPIIRLELGSAEDINNLVFQWRSSLSTRKSPSEGPQDPAIAIREKVWLPIAKHLEGAKTVIISPDGLLGTLPFTALPGEDIKKYLIEERNIAVVPFLQTLPDLLAKKESTGIASMLALGDVAYDVEAISPSSTSSLLAVRGEKGAKWNRLPGTKAEVLSIENSFKKYFPSGSLVELNQNKASEESVRESAPKSRYLHFATHGFFADESIKAMAAKQDDNKRMMGEKVVVTGENPGLLSGLVLAGANLPPKGNGDDGILTASEVAELDLTGVELAILSACETGLGKTAGGEGIFGLQRAFQLAGARTVVASSWKVPDLSTKELMVRFYGNLWEKKMGKLEALREAQLWVMKEGKAAGLDRGIDDESVVVKDTKKEPIKHEGSTKGEMLPPKYWAAWILSGAWN
jgi:CHAT domain-containing protein/Tfp pilus assembly protein PilF